MVVRSVTLDCSRGLSTSYTAADIVLDTDSASATVDIDYRVRVPQKEHLSTWLTSLFRWSITVQTPLRRVSTENLSWYSVLNIFCK